MARSFIDKDDEGPYRGRKIRVDAVNDDRGQYGRERGKHRREQRGYKPHFISSF